MYLAPTAMHTQLRSQSHSSAEVEQDIDGIDCDRDDGVDGEALIDACGNTVE